MSTGLFNASAPSTKYKIAQIRSELKARRQIDCQMMVFLGIATSDVYSSNFKVVVVLLSAVGVILTPIYLLSMLRQVFYGEQSQELHLDAVISDVKPREIFITACLLLSIIAIGFYPKLATQTYDVKAVELAAHARQNEFLAWLPDGERSKL